MAPPPPRVGEDLRELRGIVDTKIMEKVPTFDGQENHFAEWRFAFEAACGLMSLEEAM